MMKKYEKLALGLIVLLVLSHVFPFARDFYLAQKYGAAGAPLIVKNEWASASVLLAHLVNAGVALWLFMEARREKLSRWVWGVFGLVFGLFGLVVFYLLVLCKQSPKDERVDT